MIDPRLKDYYEEELRFLRRLGAEFAKQHEEIAEGLRLEPNRCDDPHVERLLEGFAFLAARVHRRIDDDFTDISQSLLSIVYPHYLRPTPSMSVVEFQPDPDQGGPSSGFLIESGQSLVAPPTKGVRCRFKTCYDTTLWPIEVIEAKWQAPHELELGGSTRELTAGLRLRLKCHGDLTFKELGNLKSLRFFLNGDLSLVSTLYELLDNSCTGIVLRGGKGSGEGGTAKLPKASLVPVGFGEDEGMLPYPRRSFLGYRLLQEYFTFPYKFFFFDLTGLERLGTVAQGNTAEVIFLIGPFEGPDRDQALNRFVTRDTIRLGCTPVVNLFEGESEPVRLNQRRTEYTLRARGSKEFPPEIFSVDGACAITPSAARRIPFAPFFSYRNRQQGEGGGLFWHERRHASSWLPGGATDVSLAFVDQAGTTVYPEFPSASAQLTCFNGRLPSMLSMGSEKGDLDLEGGGAPLKATVALMHPTEPIQPPLDGSIQWRLISQLSLNYLSLVGEDSPETARGLMTPEGGKPRSGAPLRELLRLYNSGDSSSGEKHVQGITAVNSEPWYARVRSDQGLSFARGRRIFIDLDEDHFSGGGIYLFASVIERFLALYASMNSFSALVARVHSKRKTYTLREWEPRAGYRTLI
ncbi:MAG: type VI secretion system baseplate subunit TssF [Gemmatimonadota bacterium]